MFSIDDRGQTDCVTALTYDLDFQPEASCRQDTHTRTQKKQLQTSVGSQERVETNGRTNGQTDGQTYAIDCFSFPANAVGNYGKTDAMTATR